jgi:predicted ATP-grasp superfamily ATP-dependent carboligase
MASEKRVLVTDGDQRASLAVARSLGRAGWRVIVGERRSRSLAAVSRYASAEVILPDPSEAPHEYAREVIALSQRLSLQAILPITEASALALLNVPDQLGHLIPMPPLSVFRAVCDKAHVLEVAKLLGIRTPAQYVVTDPSTCHADIATPVVLKPARSVNHTETGTTVKVSVQWARTEVELHRKLAEFPPAAFPVLAQEVITGPGIGVFVLMQDGMVRAAFGHQRIREKPPSGGVSVLRRSLPVPAELLEKTSDLLRCLEWTGVAMVEYKRDVRTGDHVLMEINGRFWGSLQLAIDSGIDFPRLLMNAHEGLPIEQPPCKPTISRWFWGDVDHLLAVWRDPLTPASLRMDTLLGFLKAFGPRYKEEVFRWTDPLPFLMESWRWLTPFVAR